MMTDNKRLVVSEMSGRIHARPAPSASLGTEVLMAYANGKKQDCTDHDKDSIILRIHAQDRSVGRDWGRLCWRLVLRLHHPLKSQYEPNGQTGEGARGKGECPLGRGILDVCNRQILREPLAARVQMSGRANVQQRDDCDAPHASV